MAFFNGRVHSDEQANEGVGARVEDYLDDKFQNAVDLENIEVVLEGVLKQQKLLKQQVRDLYDYHRICLIFSSLKRPKRPWTKQPWRPKHIQQSYCRMLEPLSSVKMKSIAVS